MNKKVKNLVDLEYYNALNHCNTFLKKWRDAKPENEELKEFALKYLHIVFHTNFLETERYGYELSFAEYLNDKLKAEQEVEKIKKENQRLVEENNKLKKIVNL